MDDGRGTLIHLYFIAIYAMITMGLIFFRILLFFFEFPEMVEQAKDYDYILLIKGMENGLVNFYDPIPGYDWPPYYLYFWYFIFFPMYLIPVQIGVYVWDVIRLIAGIYIAKLAPKVFKNKFNLLIFYLLSTISYSLDAYYNNCNFLIAFFLFNSYIALEKKKKWISGIFFTLAMFKINSIFFPFILLSIKKIKFKDLKYYLTPFLLVCVPYFIFPNYFMKMFHNWCHSDEFVNGLTILDSILWKGLQPSHLMTISLFLIVLFENIKSNKRKNQFKFLVLPTLITYYIYITAIVFVIPVFFT